MRQDDPNAASFLGTAWNDNPERLRLVEAIVSGILERVPLTSEMDLMDYGCGSGAVVFALQPYVRHITAADTAQAALDALASTADEKGIINVTPLLLDLERDPPPAGRFHAVICTMTLHHIKDTERLVRLFAGMLHPGGYLCIADLDKEPGVFHIDGINVRHNGFDREELSGLFRKAGFRDVAATTAYTVTKPTNRGDTGQFPIFLMTGVRGVAACR